MAENRKMSDELLREFIELYKSQPCLWKTKSPDYLNKVKKHEAYSKLVDLIKPNFRDADKEFVIRKINTIRGCFRKELNKVRGAGSDTVYKPSLWYFDLLKFTCDQEISRSSSSLSNQETLSNKEEITESQVSYTINFFIFICLL